MSKIPENLKYTKDHEWAKVEGNHAVIGITDHAQSSLGDIAFVELPEVGKELNKGDGFGVVESIKAVSDLYSPVTGKVVEVNSELASTPEKVNQDPYDSAWMIKIEVTDLSTLEDLMDSSSYEEFVKSEA